MRTGKPRPRWWPKERLRAGVAACAEQNGNWRLAEDTGGSQSSRTKPDVA
jgi:hypothetical protein